MDRTAEPLPRDWRTAGIGLALGLVVLGALATGSTTLVFALTVPLVLASIASPATGIAMVAFLAPLMGKPVLPTPGLVAILLAGVVAGSVIRLIGERPRLSIPIPVLCGLGFFLFIFAQQIPAMLSGYSGDAELTGSSFLRIATGLAAVVAVGLVFRRRDPLPVLLCLVASSAIVVALAVLMFDNPNVSGPLAELVAIPDADQRPSGVFANPNYFGWFAATMVVLTVGLVIARIGWGLRVALVVVAVLLGIGVAISQSRGALLSAGTGLVLLIFMRNRVAGLVTAGAAAVAAVVVLPLLVEWRLTNSIGAASIYAQNVLADSDAGRLDAVLVGPRLFFTSPILGIGLGGYVNQSGTYSHNWYMSVLAEQGIVGVVLWGLLILTSLAVLLRLPSTPRAIGVAVLAVWSVSSMFLEPPLETQGSVPTAMILVICVAADWRLLEAVPRVRAAAAGFRRARRPADDGPAVWQPPAWTRPWVVDPVDAPDPITPGVTLASATSQAR